MSFHHSLNISFHARPTLISTSSETAKREMIKAKKKATEEYIEGMYYRKMYDSAACLKGDVRVMDRELKKLTSDTA